MTMTPDVNVVLIDFKNTKANEMVTENEDGSFTIFLNARLSNEGQLRAYQHAMKHIEENDFDRTDVQFIESKAHDQIPVNTTPAVPSMPADVFLERLQNHRKRREQTRRRMKRYKEKLDFILEYGDTFAMAEHNYLYGKDL